MSGGGPRESARSQTGPCPKCVNHTESLEPMFTLDQVMPWGRSFDEYRRMFALTEADLDLRIVGCGDGPASFNAEATRRGAAVVSCDPLYRYDVEQIRVPEPVNRPTLLQSPRRGRCGRVEGCWHGRTVTA